LKLFRGARRRSCDASVVKPIVNLPTLRPSNAVSIRRAEPRRAAPPARRKAARAPAPHVLRAVPVWEKNQPATPFDEYAARTYAQLKNWRRDAGAPEVDIWA